MSDALLSQLSRRLARSINESEMQRARLHLLDWLACVAGARLSDVAGKGGMLSLRHSNAALMGNVLEMDDVHRTALLHPGPVIWPAVFSQHLESLDQALAAAIRGYEAMIFVGTALDAHHYAHWHPTATAGSVGAAAAVADVLGADWDNQAVWAMANAASVAGGVWHMRHDDVLTKQWHVYHAATTGSEAALAALHGITGPAAVLEGPQGLFAAMTQTPRAPGSNGEGWLIEQVSFKPWAACRHAHPAIDAAMELRASGKLEAPFHVETFADALTFCDRPNPTTELEAKFSLQHAVAVVADGRKAEPEDFAPAAIAALAELRAQVSVAEDPAITARYPAHFGARVNGLELVDTLGDPERPVGEAEICAKARSLFAWGGLDAAEADHVIELALRGDDAEAIDTWLMERTT
jgi:2-methylcitrate dehydratase PrpD